VLRREIIEPNIARHSGRLFKIMGDGFLVEFASAVQAVTCAMAIQKETEEAAATLTDAQKMRLRIGIHVGDVMVEGDDLLGDGVNIAARLESIAAAGGVSVSRAVHDQVRDRIDVSFDDKGEIALKNIARPVQVFAVAGGKVSAPKNSSEATPALALPDKPSIAVLPFQNMSGDPEQEYFADGMVEDIITGLSRSKSLFVIARNSSFTYKGKAVDIKQVGRELGVRYVLEGSVRKAGNRIRITGQLIDAATGAHIWADKFDSQLEDIFDLQDRITSNVIGAISPQLERAEMERAQRKPTESLQAYDYYLRALFNNYRFTREANIEQLKLAKTATAIDPEFAAAYALGALAFVQSKTFGWSKDSAEDAAEARQLARRAIELDKDDPRVLAMAGQTLSFVVGEVETGAALLARAISLDPNLAAARYWNGFILTYMGEVDTAIDQFNMALRLSPLDPRIFLAHLGLAFAHFLAGRYDDGSLCAKIAIQQ
jgi:adenylate cyclase